MQLLIYFFKGLLVEYKQAKIDNSNLNNQLKITPYVLQPPPPIPELFPNAVSLLDFHRQRHSSLF